MKHLASYLFCSWWFTHLYKKYIRSWSTLLYEQLSCLLISYYTVYTHLLTWKSLRPSWRIELWTFRSPVKHFSQDTSRCWLIAYDLVFIKRQIYSFWHNMINFMKYFSLMHSCIKINWINVLCYQILALMYNENYFKQKNRVLL